METSQVRNFCIISHVDHGKSTLADRFLELTNTIPKEKMKPQYLDSMGLEREKGITIKMHPCRMIYHAEILNPKSEILNNLEIRNSKLEIANSEYILNLIDTPGHIDFSYEISRALAAAEGAILLVDATSGIQAQTLFNLEMAQRQNLKIIGAVNKIDSKEAKIEETKKDLSFLLKVPPEEIFLISAKEGTNILQLLEAVIEKIPPPPLFAKSGGGFRALIFDSKYDPFYGVIAYVRVFDGEIKKGEKIYLMATDIFSEAKEVGYFVPELKNAEVLKTGDIGYIKTGIKNPNKVKVGDTICQMPNAKFQIPKIEALPGYKEPQPVLFLSLYPQNPENFLNLKGGLEKLKLNDPALHFELESKKILGQGFRCGFLGSLHAEIVLRRLKEDYDLDLITTSPAVIFKILTEKGKENFISSASDFPRSSEIKEIKEPWIKLKIITPLSYFNSIFKILKNFKAKLTETNSFSFNKLILIAEAPLKQIETHNFYDKLKSATSGYASFSFENIGFRPADVVKLDILIAKEKEEAFSRIVDRDEAYNEGKTIVSKLKEVLPPEQFEVPLQAAIEEKVVARETIEAKRKDVTAPLYGGDVTRKRKLLEIQKKGKRELKKRGRVRIPFQTYLEMLKS